MTPQEAISYVEQQLNASWSISQADVETLLASTRGTTFAGLVQVTPVKLAAAHKARCIYKVTVANVQLFNNLNAFTNAYQNAVRRSAARVQSNDQAAVAAFESQGNWFTHEDCYSIVRHSTKPSQKYLFGIYNFGESLYVENGAVVSKQHVAQYLTPAESDKLLNPPALVRNVTHDIEHGVIVRTVALDNIVRLQVRGEQAEIA
jgi:hypothetical protein